jgi:transporter family-2 protein
MQIAVQGRLGDRVGSLEAVATAAVIGGVLALVLLLVVRRSLGGIEDAVAGPKWQLLGGIFGVAIVFGITFAAARIGVLATTAFLITAQFALAAIIDRLGWFGVDRVAVTWPRVTGIVLLAVGAALTLRR